MSWQPGAPVGYAHRGFSPDGLENTLAAFQAAVQLGYRHLETDARVSADAVAVAFHDRNLDRLTNHTGPVAQRSWSELARARVLGREPIPLLEDVLAGFGEVMVNIDVKSHTAIGPTLDAVRRTASWHRVRLAAFSHSRVLALRQAAGPAVATALTPPEVAGLRSGRRPRLDTRRWDAAAQVPPALGALPLITAGFVETAHSRGIAVHAWTVNQRAEMIRLLDLGVDAIITDRADLLRALLRERGHWPG
ncbi:MAG: glycerophosphodiester phosphodiesterase family protein [Jatrophihabitans sp.]